MNLQEYLIQNHPAVFAEYTRYLTRDHLPKAGDTVVTLRSGFGGGAGLYRTVDSVDGEYIHLSGGGYKFLCSIDEWYKSLVIAK